MKNLVIGNVSDFLQNTYTETDIFEGLARVEKFSPQFILVNIPDLKLTEDQLARFAALLKEVRIPTLILSNTPQIQELNKLPKTKVIREDATEKEIRRARFSLIKFLLIENSAKWLYRNKFSISYYAILAALFFEPVAKLVIYHLDYSPSQYSFESLKITDNVPKFFEFWLLFPLAGFALVKRSMYSIAIFSMFHAYCKSDFLKSKKVDFVYLVDTHPWALKALLVLNIGLIGYLVLPQKWKNSLVAKKDFFRKSARLKAALETHLRVNRLTHPAKVSNISETGVLVSTDQVLLKQSEIEIDIDGKLYSCVIARKVKEDNGVYTYGLRFQFRSWKERNHMRDFIELKVQNDEFLAA